VGVRGYAVLAGSEFQEEAEETIFDLSCWVLAGCRVSGFRAHDFSPCSVRVYMLGAPWIQFAYFPFWGEDAHLIGETVG